MSGGGTGGGLRERLARLRDDVRGIDGRVAVVLLTTAVVLTWLEFWPIREAFDGPYRDRDLEKLGRWAGACVIGYLVVPALIVRFVFGERLRDFGLSVRGFVRHLPIYVALYAIVAPVVLIAFRLVPESARVYPFYPGARDGLEAFVRWQLLYGLQFLALEFFFRGFLLFGLERRFGLHAILVMVVPYCMIHYRKSAAEALAAVVAGLALGLLAMRTRSVLGGVLIHWAVAITADLAVIQSTGGFGPGG